MIPGSNSGVLLRNKMKIISSVRNALECVVLRITGSWRSAGPVLQLGEKQALTE